MAAQSEVPTKARGSFTSKISPLILLLLAGIIPLAVIICGSLLFSSARKIPAKTAEPVRGLSDYIDSKEADMRPPNHERNVLPLWNDKNPRSSRTTTLGARFAVVGRTLTLISGGEMIVIDSATGNEIRRIESTDEFDLATATAVNSAAADGRLWLYSARSGYAAQFEPLRSIVPLNLVYVGPGLGQPHWRGDTIVTNGTFADGLIRIYTPSRGRSGPDESAARAVTTTTANLRTVIGRPLYPGLAKTFSQQLNTSSMGINERVSKLVLAFKWIARLHVYDVETMALERAIAGPQESRLHFAVARTDDGSPVFTLSDETMYAYVDVCATDKAIVALYAGRERRHHPGLAALGTELHTFSWDGRPLGRWYLREPVAHIACDDQFHVFGLRYPERAIVAIESAGVLGLLDKGIAPTGRAVVPSQPHTARRVAYDN